MVKFSFIIPIYGKQTDHNIMHCIDALLRQTDKNFEIIISGNKVLPSNPQIMNGINVYNTEVNTNRLGLLMNEGFKMCTGEYIHIWNPDLMIYPDYVEILNDYILKYGEDNLYAGHLIDMRGIQSKKEPNIGLYFKSFDLAEGFCCFHKKHLEQFREEFEGFATHWCQEFLYRMNKKIKFICMRDSDIVHIPHIMRISYDDSVISSQKSSQLYEAMKCE